MVEEPKEDESKGSYVWEEVDRVEIQEIFLGEEKTAVNDTGEESVKELLEWTARTVLVSRQ